MHKPGVSAFQRGESLIEVLVTVLLIAFGLLGMSGMLTRLQATEMESYQRSQAMLLLNDMANKMSVNRNAAASYVTTATSPLGAGMTCPTASSTSTVVQRDKAEWCNALQGAGETMGSGATRVGAMIGGRGCVETTAVANEYLVTVAWQGLVPIAAPPSSVACGAGSYNTTGTSCISDLCRRTVTTLVRIANLSS